MKNKKIFMTHSNMSNNNYIIEISLYEKKYINFIYTDKRNVSVTTNEVSFDVFNDEITSYFFTLQKMISENIPKNVKDVCFILNCSDVNYNYYDLPNINFFNNKKVFDNEVLKYLDDNDSYIYVKKKVSNKLVLYRSISIPNRYFDLLFELSKKLKINIKEFISNGDYLINNLDIKENNVIYIKHKYNFFFVYIYNKDFLVNQHTFKANSDSFVVDLTLLIANYEDKVKCNIDKIYIDDKSGNVAKVLEEYDLNYEEITHEK